MNEEEKVKTEALIDNTAQGIFNYLKEIENKREIYEKRWIWELLQNALDAAPQDRKFELLEGYPLLSLKEKTFVYLGKDRKDKPLAPKNVWNEKARGYEAIFTQEFLS